MKSFIAIALLAIGVSLPQAAWAGPGANLLGCIDVDKPEYLGKVAIFEPSPSFEEMSRTGHAGRVPLDGMGLRCAEVGYVEAIRGGNLWSSKWTLGYRLVKIEKGPDGKDVEHETRFSDSVTTEWAFAGFLGGNKMWIVSNSPGTSICGLKVRCTDTKVTWADGTQGPFHILFRPSKR